MPSPALPIWGKMKMEKTKRQWKNKQNWLMCLVMLIFCGLLCLLPDEHLNITSRFPREKVRIEQVDNSMLDAIGIVYNGVQPCRVKILTGDYAGEEYQSYNYLNSALDKDKLFEAGDIAWAMIQPGSGQGAPVVTLIDHYRITAEAGIVAILALLLIGFGGVIGCGAMGALYGGYLSRNNDVTLVERNPDRIAKIRADGLRIAEPDGYDKIIGASAEECAMVLSAYIPQHKGEIDGGVDIPLIYVFIYEKNEIHTTQDYAFIRGQLLTFEQMEKYKIYEDEQYVCYDVSDLFYSDLRQYVESMVSQRSDVYFDELVWERVQNIYTYYRDNMGTLLGYRTDTGRGTTENVTGNDASSKLENKSNTCDSLPEFHLTIESCYDNPNEPVADQSYNVGEPNWND